jgi:AcrR family transcriptional regulator
MTSKTIGRLNPGRSAKNLAKGHMPAVGPDAAKSTEPSEALHRQSQRRSIEAGPDRRRKKSAARGTTARRPEKLALVWREIVAAAGRTLGARGLAETSLRAVAKAARYSPAALYAYFPNKRALLTSVFAEELGQLSRATRPAPAVPNEDRMAEAALALYRQCVERWPRLVAGLAGGREDKHSEIGRRVAGRLIGLLRPFAQPEPKMTQADADRALTLFALILGLAALERSGWLEALDSSGERLARTGIETLRLGRT